MKIKEVTNPEEQLGLLRVIIDNTWSAIKQQADAQARHKVAQPAPKSKTKAPKAPRPAPYAAMPKQLPKPKALNLSKPQQMPQPISSPVNKYLPKQTQSNIGAPKIPLNNLPIHSTPSLSNNEKDELINSPRISSSKPL